MTEGHTDSVEELPVRSGGPTTKELFWAERHRGPQTSRFTVEAHTRDGQAVHYTIRWQEKGPHHSKVDEIGFTPDEWAHFLDEVAQGQLHEAWGDGYHEAKQSALPDTNPYTERGF